MCPTQTCASLIPSFSAALTASSRDGFRYEPDPATPLFRASHRPVPAGGFYPDSLDFRLIHLRYNYLNALLADKLQYLVVTLMSLVDAPKTPPIKMPGTLMARRAKRSSLSVRW